MSSQTTHSDSQINFNPSWMPQKTSIVSKTDKTSDHNKPSSILESEEKTCEPVFAKYSYGREDLLALNNPNVSHPLGIEACIFSTGRAQQPVILTPLNENEMKLQHNINSSKALTPVNRQDRHPLNGLVESPPLGSISFGSSNSNWGPSTGVFRNNNNPMARRHPQSHGGNVQHGGSMSSRWSSLSSSNGGASKNWRNNYDRGRDEQQTSLASRQHETPEHDSGGFAVKNNEIGVPPAGDLRHCQHQAFSSQQQQLDSSKEPNGELIAEQTPLPPQKLDQQESSSFPPNHPAYQSGIVSPSNSQNIQQQQQMQNIRRQQPQSTEENISRGLSSATGTYNTNDPSSLQHQQQQQQQIPPLCKWIYLDPNGVQRGPFDSQQMLAWFTNGYFNNGLRLCRDGDHSFTTLGELISINGAASPFVDKDPVQKQQPLAVDSNKPTGAIINKPLKQNISSSLDYVVENHISPKLVDVEKIWTNPLIDDIATTSALHEKERHILEEQMKLREKEEMLRRDECDRLEKERKIREMEMELDRKKDEIARAAREKELELEMRCMQLAEYERKRREELELLEQKIKTEQFQQQIKKEEEDRKRLKDLEEIVKLEQEKQRQILEAGAKRIREEEEASLRATAIEEAKRAALIEAKRLEEERRQRKALEEEKKKQKIAQESVARNATAITPPTQHSGTVGSCGSFVGVGNSSPTQQKNAWNVVQRPQTQKLLLNEKEQNVPPSNPPPNSVIPQSQQPKTWNKIPVAQPAPIPKISSLKQPANPQKPPINKQQSKPESHSEKRFDEFTSWIIARVKELNSTVDAEVFASFIQGLDSPNEVEEYIIGYMGESKVIKDFYREFLNKRIELRPRVKASKKDDLSGPAPALDDIIDKNTNQNVGIISANSKKKKTKAHKVLDPRSLGFKPSGDPNRINQGEFDTIPPMTTANNKKR